MRSVHAVAANTASESRCCAISVHTPVITLYNIRPSLRFLMNAGGG